MTARIVSGAAGAHQYGGRKRGTAYLALVRVVAEGAAVAAALDGALAVRVGTGHQVAFPHNTEGAFLDVTALAGEAGRSARGQKEESGEVHCSISNPDIVVQ